MISSLQTGEKRLHELYARYGKETVSAVMQEYIRYSERLLRSAIRALPEGSFTWTDYIDEDPGIAEADKKMIKVQLTIRIQDGRLIYDFSESDPADRGRRQCADLDDDVGMLHRHQGDLSRDFRSMRASTTRSTSSRPRAAS